MNQNKPGTYVMLENIICKIRVAAYGVTIVLNLKVRINYLQCNCHLEQINSKRLHLIFDAP